MLFKKKAELIAKAKAAAMIAGAGTISTTSLGSLEFLVLGDV